MADDNILEVGALINLEQYLPGVDLMASETKVATSAMSASFQQLGTTTLSSTAQMTTAFVPVTAAMQVIPLAVQEVAVKTETATTEMGASWLGLAGTVESAAVAMAGSLTGIGAKISETAERSRLGVGTMETAFAGLSSLLGAGIAVGFAAHFLDETARVTIELEHLKTTTGIAIETLAGLRAVAQQNAIPFEQMQTALIRMQRAQVLAVEGNQSLRTAFHTVGIELDQLKTLSPEELFFALAKGISESDNKQVAATASMQLLGRGAITLIPLFEKLGGNLRDLTAEAGKNSGINDQAAEAAMRWHKETAQLAQLFQSAMVPVLEKLIDVLPKVAHGFDLIGAVVNGLYDIVRVLVLEFSTGMAEIAVLLNDTFGSGSFTDIPKHAEHAVAEMTQIFKDGITDITANFKAGRADWDAIFDKAPPKTWFQQAQDMLDSLKKPSGTDLSDLLDINKHGNTQVQQWREQLDQMRDAQIGFHELSKSEEAEFWKAKLAIAGSNTKVYREVYHEYVTAEREANRQSLSEEVNSVEQRVQAERTGSTQRIVIIQEELAHLQSLHAEETSEYRRLQSQLIVAQREAAKEDERSFSERVTVELSEARSVTEKMVILTREQLRAELAGYDSEGEAFKRLKQEELNVQRQAVEENRAIANIETEIALGHSQTRLEIRRSEIQNQFSLGLIGAAQRTRLLIENLKQEEQLELNAVIAKQALYQKDTKDYEEAEKQKAAITDRYERQMTQIAEQQNTARLAGFKRFTDGMVSDFTQAINQMRNGQKTFGQAMAQLWNQMLTQFIDMLAKMLLQWIITHTIMKAFAALTNTDTSSDKRNKEAQVAVNDDAATAEADVFKQAIEMVPFPFNLAAAPAAAATVRSMFSAIASQIGGSAEKGALLPRDMNVAAHAKEMILPAPISTGLQNVIAAGGFNVPPALTQNFSSVGANTNSASSTTRVYHTTVSPTIEYHQHEGDGPNFDELHSAVMNAVRVGVRNGQIKVGLD